MQYRLLYQKRKEGNNIARMIACISAQFGNRFPRRFVRKRLNKISVMKRSKERPRTKRAKKTHKILFQRGKSDA
jgi:hypothetical protein